MSEAGMPDGSEEARIHLLISGRVQGVFYRASAREKALSLPGITGWVRNLVDGRVELTAEGRRDLLTALVSWCREGPTYAAVDLVEVDWSEHRGEFTGFRIVG